MQTGAVFTLWLQLRGSSWIEAKEGRFRLRSGDWIAFERDSRPALQSDRHGVCIGLSLTQDALRTIGRLADSTFYAGRGHVSRSDARTTLRLWREASRRLTAQEPGAAADVGALWPLLLHLTGLQADLAARVERCPGRSRNRKRQVFARLQRSLMYLEGHCDRMVRITELAELTSFSSWYFSKTFHALFDESPQAAAARLRLEHAAELLRTTSMMIGEVASASGFDNPCSFSRAFRARFGVSASRYRSAAVRRLPAPEARRAA
ncbi:transcriptional regulator [Lysobacter bugurensis]|uniref:Transcriptional regulator n=1 Tax=Cognatilysobacter bugurensis TaxID=543356 RepID=A0A918T006_9GAMM|nr:transcriptional regulator [Lysobacter bugurensis]